MAARPPDPRGLDPAAGLDARRRRHSLQVLRWDLRDLPMASSRRGLENTKPPTKKEGKHISADEAAEGHRLACQTTITGPVKVSWVPLKDRKK